MPSGLSLTAAQLGQLRVQAVQLLLRLDQLRILASRISLHALNLHFLGGDLCAQLGGRFNQRARLAVELDQSSLLLHRLQGLFGVCQVLIRLLELLLEKQPALAGLSDGQILGEVAELIDISIGKLGGAARDR